MTITVRTVRGDGDLATTARIVSAASPNEPTTVEEMHWADTTYPGGIRLLADLDGKPVGAASVGRIHVHEPGFDALWGTVDVLEHARRQGVGSRLLAAIRAATVAAGKSALHIPASEARPEGIAFLEHRGFTEYERSRSVHLPLASIERPSVATPDGIRLTTLEAAPDLVAGVHAVASEAIADIPGGELPMDVGDLAEFRARDVDREVIPPWGFIVAVEAATGSVVGYTSLLMVPGSSTEAWHDMTAVARSWRGRGVASALKRAGIGVAMDHGLTDLRTYNDESNVGMQTVNARLGYRPLPDELTMRGSAESGIIGR
jgi:GNAT superfamily N-acetyltransferase